MKKFLIIAVTAAMILSLTACGNNKEKPSNDGTKNEVTSTKPVVNAVEFQLKDKVIIDNELIKLTVSSLKINTSGNLEINFLCENKSAKKLNLHVKNAAICGYAIPSAYWTQELDAGKKANSVMTIGKQELELAYVDVMDEMTLRIAAKAMEGNYDDIMEETVSIYPTGLDASKVVFKDRKPVEGERVIVDNEQFKYIIESVEYDPNNGYVVRLFIENKTSKYLWLRWDELSVNDFMIGTSWGAEVLPGLRLYTRSIISSYDLEKNNIEKLDKFEFVLRASNGDDYFNTPDCLKERFVYELTK